MEQAAAAIRDVAASLTKSLSSMTEAVDKNLVRVEKLALRSTM